MRKNFILTALLFLFINILGFANEKSKDIDVISILDKEREASYFILNFSSFTESKEIMDYINTNINKMEKPFILKKILILMKIILIKFQ